MTLPSLLLTQLTCYDLRRLQYLGCLLAHNSTILFHHSIPPNQDTVATVIRRDKLNSQLIIITKFSILHAGGHRQSLFRFQTSRELECRWLCSSSSAYHIYRATAMTSFSLHFCMANWNSITHFVEPALHFFHDKLETCIQVYAYNMCYSSTDWVVVVVPGGGLGGERYILLFTCFSFMQMLNSIIYNWDSGIRGYDRINWYSLALNLSYATWNYRRIEDLTQWKADPRGDHAIRPSLFIHYAHILFENNVNYAGIMGRCSILINLGYSI